MATAQSNSDRKEIPDKGDLIGIFGNVKKSLVTELLYT